MKKYFVLTGMMAALQTLSVMAQPAEADTLAARLAVQTRLFPQEKIFVHTDKPYYMAGDTVWLRAHVALAATNRPVTDSKYVYIELASSEKPPIGQLPEPPLRIRIIQQNSVYAGYIPLPMTAKSGDYTLSAYTAFMRNLGPEYFFQTNLYVSAYGSRYEKQNRQRSGETDFDVSFFPEGGYLVDGSPCTVGFKALKPDGGAATVSGRIVDGNGAQVATFETLHAGMGKISFTPQAGKIYFAQCVNAAGSDKRIRMPEVRSDVAVLQVFPTAERFSAGIAAGKGIDTNAYSLLIQCRGRLCYYGAWESSKKILAFDRKEFPDGVLQLLLLDPAKKVVSERLLFCYNDSKNPGIDVSPDNPSYGRRAPVRISIACRDNDLKPLEGDFSLAVTDNRIIDPHRTADIRTALLLESELRGHIEDPTFYFDPKEPTRAAAADALMLTQGWRRYDVPKVLAGQYDSPSEPIEIGQEIAGQLQKTGIFRKRNFKGYKVSTMAPKTGLFTSTSVSSEGRFALNGFDLPDSTQFVLQATGPEGQTDVAILIDKQLFPKMKTLSPPDWAQKMNRYNRNIGNFTDTLKNILLDEIIIMGKKKDPQAYYEVLATQTLDSKELENNLYNDLAEALRSKHGVNEIGGYIYIFGRPAKFIIDGTFWEPDGLMDGLSDKYPRHIPMEMVKRIDIIPPVNTTIFGSQVGHAGVIFITTKTGKEFMDTKRPDPQRVFMQVAKPLGYQTPAEFYSPTYDTPQRWNAHERDLRTTLYWNPNVQLQHDGTARIEFYTGDEGADYTVTIQGIAQDGTIVSKQQQIGAIE